MSKPLTQYEIEFIISRVIPNANDSVDDAKENPGEFNDGRKQAYYKVLDTIKNELLLREQDLSEYGYDDDWEYRLMF